MHDYCVAHYESVEYQFDFFVPFMERSVTLCKSGGRVSMITPNVWLNNQSNTKLRRYLLERCAFESIADYSTVRVFPTATVLPIVWVLIRDDQAAKLASVSVRRAHQAGPPTRVHDFKQSVWLCDRDAVVNIDLAESELPARERIEANGVALDTLAEVKFGIKLYETGKGTPPQSPDHAKCHIFEADYQKEPDYRPYLEGKDVQRFGIDYASRWLKYGQCLAAPRDPGLFEGPRILVRRIVGRTLIATYTDGDFVTSQLLQVVKPLPSSASPLYLLGLLNSVPLAWYLLKKYNRRDKTFPEVRIYELASLPIRPIDFSNPADMAKHDKMVSLVETMLDLHKRLPEAKTPGDKSLVERQITATDNAIDRLVYDLYELTAEEIAIVEGTAK